MSVPLDEFTRSRTRHDAPLPQQGALANLPVTQLLIAESRGGDVGSGIGGDSAESRPRSANKRKWLLEDEFPDYIASSPREAGRTMRTSVSLPASRGNFVNFLLMAMKFRELVYGWKLARKRERERGKKRRSGRLPVIQISQRIVPASKKIWSTMEMQEADGRG